MQREIGNGFPGTCDVMNALEGEEEDRKDRVILWSPITDVTVKMRGLSSFLDKH